jgi:hypothetical protein
MSAHRRTSLQRFDRSAWTLLSFLAAGGFLGSIWLSLTCGFVPLLFLTFLWALLALPFSIFLVSRRSTSPSAFQRLVVTCVLLTFSVVLTDWPFRAAVRLSRQALTEAIPTPQAPLSHLPRRLGAFPIRAIEARGEVVAFWTDLGSAGRSGLVYSPSGTLPFNLWSQQSLGRGWYFVVED